MFTDVHLMAGELAAEERARYSVDRILLHKDGRAIATDGKFAIVVGKIPEDAGTKEDIYLDSADAKMLNSLLRPVKQVGAETIKLFDIEKVSDEKCKIENIGLHTEIPHWETSGFPDVDEAVRLNNPKKNPECKSAYVNLTILKKIVDTLTKMTKESSGIEIFIATKPEDNNMALRIEAKGKNEEKIEVTLMQMMCRY